MIRPAKAAPSTQRVVCARCLSMMRPAEPPPRRKLGPAPRRHLDHHWTSLSSSTAAGTLRPDSPGGCAFLILSRWTSSAPGWTQGTLSWWSGVRPIGVDIECCVSDRAAGLLTCRDGGTVYVNYRLQFTGKPVQAAEQGGASSARKRRTPSASTKTPSAYARWTQVWRRVAGAGAESACFVNYGRGPFWGRRVDAPMG